MDKVQTSLIELNTTVGAIHGDVQSITNSIDKSTGGANSADGSTSIDS